MRPTVTVIMNCLNGSRYLMEALNSVYAQTYPDWEIIFWDDASTDHSAAMARSYSSKLRYFKGPGGTPLGESRNLAFAQAQGQYLAILDCDDHWEPDKLLRQVGFLEKHPYVGLVASDCWIMDADGTRDGTLFGRVPFPDGDPDRALLCGRNFLASPTLLMRTNLVRTAGGCTPTYRYAELFDLCVRLSKAFLIDALELPLASYRIHAGNRGGTGCVGMTEEVLDVLRRHRPGAPVGQYVREAVLRARLGWQRLVGMA